MVIHYNTVPFYSTKPWVQIMKHISISSNMAESLQVEYSSTWPLLNASN